MRAIWGWINSEGSPSEITANTLRLSTYSYRKLWPDDYLVLYTNERSYEICTKLPEGYRDEDFWDEVVCVPNEAGCPVFHDWSRYYVMTLQDSPFIYVDADFIITDDQVQRALGQIRNKLKLGKRKSTFYVAYYKYLENDLRVPFALGSKNNLTIKAGLQALDYDYSLLKPPLGIQATPIVFGSFPLESYVLGTEVCTLMDRMSKNPLENIHSSAREWVAGMFYRLVATRFQINIDFNYLVDPCFHVGCGGDEPWILCGKKINRHIQKEVWEKMLDNYLCVEGREKQLTFDTLYKEMLTACQNYGKGTVLV